MLCWIALVLLLHTAAKAQGACEKGSLPCDNGQCVSREGWCDGTETCDDGSDEAHCKEPWWGLSRNKCNKKIHFQCEDGRCWPLAARCDGIADCRDDSDEENCEPEVKQPDKSDEKIEEPDKFKENSEETKDNEDKDKSKESSEETKDNEDEDKSKESSEENKDKDEEESSEEDKKEPKESAEEKENEEATTTAKPTSQSDYDDYDEYTTEAYSPTTTVKVIPSLAPTSSPTKRYPLVFSTESPFRSPTTEMDFYAKKMEQSEVKRQFSTQRSVPPTSAYRQASVRPYVLLPTTSRTTVQTRPYTPRPYRYIGAGQTPSPYRERYPVSQPHYPSASHRGYHDNNYISSQSRNNHHHQQYRNANGLTNGPPRAYGRQLRVPSRFYFKKSYDQIYARANHASVRRGVNWLLSIRNASGGWGKETPRALVAYSLVNNSFLTGSYEKDLMHKYFQVHLAVNLLRDKPVSLNRLAMFANALIATCQDPRDFQGWDLTELIRSTILKLNRASKPPLINPLVYLSLCLADRNLTHYEVHHLMTYLVATRNDEATRDMMCLALEAFGCHMQKEAHNAGQYYTLQKMVWNATSKILERKKEDGSFGSVYSTALAVQALMSVNETREWDLEPTFRFLRSHQQRNGSFGDFLATYQVLPALSGRSLLHLRNTRCDPPRVDRELSPQEILQHPGPKSYIRYSLHMGSPLSTGYTVQVLVPTGISFFDVMRVAAFENDHFKFSYEEVSGKINVYSISDIPNDPEEGLAWRLYVRSSSDNGNVPNIQHLYTGDIREFQPTPDQHVIFWYHPLGF